MDLLSEHRKTYDALAKEYEARVEANRPNSEKAISFFVSYIKTGKDVLDVGCGPGLSTEILARKGFTATGIDISLKMIKLAKKRTPSANFITADFLNYDFGKKFDGVFMSAFIHLFPKAMAFNIIKKAFKILKPDGILYLGTTKSRKSSEGWEEKTDYKNKLRRYRKHWTAEEMQKTLENAGFKIISAYEFDDPFGKEWLDFACQKSD